MTEASLEELGSAFESWRKNKRNGREPVPKAMWEQTIQAAEIYGTKGGVDEKLKSLGALENKNKNLISGVSQEELKKVRTRIHDARKTLKGSLTTKSGRDRGQIKTNDN